MNRSLLLLILFLSASTATACSGRGGGLGNSQDDDDSAGGDDDDSAGDDDDMSGDDDDASGNDDDASGDDDDTSGDDDDVSGDDDDTSGDDDDTPPVDPGEAFVGETYCLDWESTNIVEPLNLVSLLQAAGINVGEQPLLLNPTAVAIPANEILMMLGFAEDDDCAQDMSVQTVNLTETEAGSYTAPSFEVGPADISVSVTGGTMSAEAAVLTGDFTGSADQITNGSLSGSLDVSEYSAYCGFVLTCYTCPSGTGDCIDVVIEDMVWNLTSNGDLIEVN